ncbi:MAG: site-specific integrase [Labilibaculum sp.]|nr:phage integrase SAM-like domain-containing protein [Labilibaculum sp.]MBI9057768.1 site-specific integrase [Labilibaculum sp.]
MATTRYLIRSKVKGKFAPFYVRLKGNDGIDVIARTELLFYPEYWSNSNQKFSTRIKETEELKQKYKDDTIKKQRDLTDFILVAFSKESGTINNEWLKNTIAEFHHGKNPDAIKKLNDYIQFFIDGIKDGSRLNSKQEIYKKGTIKNFDGFKSQFDNFKAKRKKPLQFEDITTEFYNEYVSFFVGKNYSPNTIGRHIKNLKTIIRAAHEEGHHNTMEIDRKSFKILKVETQNIYLTEKELAALLNVNLKHKPNYQIARDVFLIGCYTAQRFSDYSQIMQDNVRTSEDGTKLIYLTQKKTGEDVIIPIRPELKAILEKYDYNTPKIWEQKLNKYIKEVGKLAKIKEPIAITKVKGGLTVHETIPKHDLIKTHTARRAGCTNMYLAGISTIDIMKISGHKTESEFLKYIKVTKEQTAGKLSNHAYFTQKLKVV